MDQRAVGSILQSMEKITLEDHPSTLCLYRVEGGVSESALPQCAPRHGVHAKENRGALVWALKTVLVFSSVEKRQGVSGLHAASQASDNALKKRSIICHHHVTQQGLNSSLH